ncbi:MAG: dienelactone hydrolase family protein [Candidatus Nitrosotenuis sp.]
MVNYVGIFAISIMTALLLSVLAIPAKAIQTTQDDSHIHFTSYESPRLQFLKTGSINMVSCEGGFDLVMKKNTGTPACVRPQTATVLIERGWAIHVLPDYSKTNNNSELFEGSSGNLAVDTENVNYFENYVGYLAAPKDSNENVYPGLVIIHEWWGLNDNIKQTAENLASNGYVVLAVDLYGKPAATVADEARKLVSSYDPDNGVSNMNGAVKFLEQRYGVPRIGSVGWCFGGGQSLNLALHNSDMDATVIYYGSLVSDKEQLSSISWPVLGIFAGLDQGITTESVNAFEKALDELGIQNEIHIYPNAEHGFANPSGQRYAPEETKDAWQKTISFLDSNLKGS